MAQGEVADAFAASLRYPIGKRPQECITTSDNGTLRYWWGGGWRPATFAREDLPRVGCRSTVEVCTGKRSATESLF